MLPPVVFEEAKHAQVEVSCNAKHTASGVRAT